MKTDGHTSFCQIYLWTYVSWSNFPVDIRLFVNYHGLCGETIISFPFSTYLISMVRHARWSLKIIVRRAQWRESLLNDEQHKQFIIFMCLTYLSCIKNRCSYTTICFKEQATAWFLDDICADSARSSCSYLIATVHSEGTCGSEFCQIF